VYFKYYRNKDREIEDIEEKHQDEIDIYKQKLKLLMYEQHVHLSEVQVGYHNRSYFNALKTCKNTLKIIFNLKLLNIFIQNTHAII